MLIVVMLDIQPLLTFDTVVVSEGSHTDAPASDPQFMQSELKAACFHLFNKPRHMFFALPGNVVYILPPLMALEFMAALGKR